MLRYDFSCKLYTHMARSGGNYWNDEFIFYAGQHFRVPSLPENINAIRWGKATIAKEPSNEQDSYAVAVLEIPALGQERNLTRTR